MIASWLQALVLAASVPWGGPGFALIFPSEGAGTAGNGNLTLDTDCLDWPTRGRLCAAADGKWFFTSEAGGVNTSVLLDTIAAAGTVVFRQSDSTALNVYATGNLYTDGNLELGTAGWLAWNASTKMLADVDGDLIIRNAAATSFGLLKFGGNTASFPALKRVGTRLEVRLANDSAYAKIQASTIELDSGNVLEFDARSKIASNQDNDITLYNNLQSSFANLNFGGTTSSFPALTRVGAGLAVRLAGTATAADLSVNELTATPSAGLHFGAYSRIRSSTDGTLLLTNNAASGFTQLRFGGTTSSFPSLKRSTTELQSRLADDSDYSPLSMGSATFNHRLNATGILTQGNNNYTVTGSENSSIIYWPPHTTTQTCVLNDAACVTGRMYIIINQDNSDNIVIDPEGTSTIDQAATYSTPSEGAAIVICIDGSGGAGAKKWAIVAERD